MDWYKLGFVVLSLAAGTALIVAQIVATLRVGKAKADAVRVLTDASTDTKRTAPVDATALLEAAKGLSTSAPLLVGGLILYGLAGLLVGEFSFTTTTTAGH